MSLEEWQAKDNDRHSIIADPMFVDATNNDFRLESNSPALELGFKSIDTSEVGLYGEAEWANLPKNIVHRKHNVPPPPSEE